MIHLLKCLAELAFPPMYDDLINNTCRVLEQTNCVGICINLCKMPSQTFIKDSFGMPLNMVPSKYSHNFFWSSFMIEIQTLWLQHIKYNVMPTELNS
jgi:hypothetical protein